MARLGAGELFGEMSLLADTPTTATVRALSPTTILFLGRAVLPAPRRRRCQRCASTSRSSPAAAASRPEGSEPPAMGCGGEAASPDAIAGSPTHIAAWSARHRLRSVMNRRRRAFGLAKVLAWPRWCSSLLLVPMLALAGPRSGGSFGGRLGFRSGGGLSVPAQLLGRRVQLLRRRRAERPHLPGLRLGLGRLRVRRRLRPVRHA